tara:strand:- start:43 stop:276 length:234 start_codon:yes stop_codon:yes gene_type:complete
MSTKEWFYCPRNSSVGGYQEMSFDDENQNPVLIQIDNPEEYQVLKDGQLHLVKIAIDARTFDSLAIAWCKKRKLNGA